MIIKNKENKAALYIFITNGLWAFYPILASQFGQQIPPIFFAALTMLVASFCCFIYLNIKGGFHHVFDQNIRFDLWMITVCIIVIPSILFFIGAKGSSGINATFLLLSELIFTIIFTHFIGEKTTRLKLMGAGGVLAGAILIVYDGNLSLNTFDLLIILSTLTYPIGNFYSKKALFKASPESILFFRTFFGGLLLLLISLVFERPENITNILGQFWWLFLINGFFVAFLTKVIWYRALKKLDISKAISLAMTFPLFGLFFLVIFFKESVSLYQFMGILVMMIGVYFTVKRPSVDPRRTKYSSQ